MGRFHGNQNFVGLVHKCRWTQAGGGAGRVNVGLGPASSF